AVEAVEEMVEEVSAKADEADPAGVVEEAVEAAAEKAEEVAEAVEEKAAEAAEAVCEACEEAAPAEAEEEKKDEEA
ncbi:MAG: hypothetical protein ACSW8K_13785, partial [bacterium]